MTEPGEEWPDRQQVKTRTTVDAGDAVGRLTDENRAIRVGTQNGVAFVTHCAGEFLVDLPVPIVDERTVLDGVDRSDAIKMVQDAQTAALVPLADTPFTDVDAAPGRPEFEGQQVGMGVGHPGEGAE